MDSVKMLIITPYWEKKLAALTRAHEVRDSHNPLLGEKTNGGTMTLNDTYTS